jgi:hypothetical protein
VFEEWEKWKDGVEMYVERVMTRLKFMMDVVKESEVDVPMTDEGPDGVTLMQFLKVKVKGGGQADRILRGVDAKRGLEAWRMLWPWFEKRLEHKGMQAHMDAKNMVGRKAKSVLDTKMMLVEMDERLRKLEECGKEVDMEQMKTVMVMWMDEETKKHLEKDLRKGVRRVAEGDK